MAETVTRAKGRPLLAEQVEEIGRRRLRGESHRSIAGALGISPTTSVKQWQKLLAARTAEFQEELDARRTEIILRYLRIADDCSAKAEEAEDERTAASYYGAEIRALGEATKLLGLEATQKVEHSGEVGFTILELGEEVRVDEDEA